MILRKPRLGISRSVRGTFLLLPQEALLSVCDLAHNDTERAPSLPVGNSSDLVQELNMNMKSLEALKLNEEPGFWFGHNEERSMCWFLIFVLLI